MKRAVGAGALIIGIASTAHAQEATVDCTPGSMSSDYGGPLARSGISLTSPAGDHFVGDAVRNGAIGKWTGENGCAESQRPPLSSGAVSNTEVWTVRQGRHVDFPGISTSSNRVCGLVPPGTSRTIYLFDEPGCKKEWRQIEILAHELGHAMRLGHTPQSHQCSDRLMYGSLTLEDSTTDKKSPHADDCRALKRETDRGRRGGGGDGGGTNPGGGSNPGGGGTDRCTDHPNTPGCPGYCASNPDAPGCGTVTTSGFVCVPVPGIGLICLPLAPVPGGDGRDGRGWTVSATASASPGATPVSPPPQATLPSAPRLTGSVSGRTQTLTWTEPTGGGITRYQLQTRASWAHAWRFTGAGTPSPSSNIAASVRSWSVVTPWSLYRQYRIRAKNAAGDGPWSNAVELRTPAAPPPPPPALTIPSIPNFPGLPSGRRVNTLFPAASGGASPYTYRVSGLPPGISFTPATRIARGTLPTVTRATSYTIIYSVTDSSARAASVTFTATVVP